MKRLHHPRPGHHHPGRLHRLRSFVLRHKGKLRPHKRRAPPTHIETVIQKFDRASFQKYVETVVATKMGAWRPRGVIIHNTDKPRLSEWPKVPALTRLKNLQTYYQGLRWNGGPHLFIGPDGIFTFNPLWKRGTHSPSFNSSFWGVELIGNMDIEQFPSMERENAIHAIACLYSMLGMQPKVLTMKGAEVASGNLGYHRDDPRTTHQACPGKNIGTKDRWVHDITERLAVLHPGDHHESRPDTDAPAEPGPKPTPAPPLPAPEPAPEPAAPVSLFDVGPMRDEHPDRIDDPAQSLHAAALSMGKPCEEAAPVETKPASQSLGIVGVAIAYLFTLLGTAGLQYTEADVQSAQHIWPQLYALGGGLVVAALGMYSRWRAAHPIKGGPADPAVIEQKQVRAEQVRKIKEL